MTGRTEIEKRLVRHRGEHELTDGRQERQEEHARAGFVDVSDVHHTVEKAADDPHRGERTRQRRIGFGDMRSQHRRSEHGERLKRILVGGVGSGAFAFQLGDLRARLLVVDVAELLLAFSE